MKKYIVIIIFTVFGCKPKPTYNAFDKIFDISINSVIKDGCDTIHAGCGWINLQQKNGRLRNYYQIYGDKVDAKGFTLYLDTINFKGVENFEETKLIKFDTQNIEVINNELKKYKFEFLDTYLNKIQEDHKIIIISRNIRDTVELDIGYNWINRKDSIIERVLFYWKPKSINK